MKSEPFISRYRIPKADVEKLLEKANQNYGITVYTREPGEDDPDILLSAITVLTEDRSDEDPDVLL